MRLCDDGHAEVCYNCLNCPVCEVFTEKSSEVEELQSRLDVLEGQLDEALEERTED